MQPRINGKYGSVPVEDRFWSKVNKTDSCWVWTGAVNQDGYGNLRYKGATRRAHRVAWELTNGQIPDKFVLDHLCRNTSCVNPLHLEVVSFAENIRRRKATGTYRGRTAGYSPRRKARIREYMKVYMRERRRLTKEEGAL